jgi:hypothetical protein
MMLHPPPREKEPAPAMTFRFLVGTGRRNFSALAGI